MSRIWVALVAALTVAGCGDDSPTEPEREALPGHIFFATLDSCAETGSVYRMSPDGSSVTLLAPGESPLPSPDGSRIAFTRHSEVIIVASDGTEERNLALSEPWAYSWSPSGNLLLVAADGGLLLFPPPYAAPDTLFPSSVGILDGHTGTPWSSDGQRIYCSDGSQIYELSIATRNARPLCEAGSHPFVSEVLGRVTFWDGDELRGCSLGGTPLNLCHRLSPFGGTAISHDRYWIAYKRTVLDSEGVMVREGIRILNLGLCGSDSLATFSRGFGSIAWSPDDKWLAVSRPASATGIRDEIIVVNVTSGQMTNVSSGTPPCRITSLGWSL